MATGACVKELVIRCACCCSMARARDLTHLRVDPREQIARRKRLDQIVVGRGGQALEPRLLAGARRQHDDRNRAEVRVGTQLPQQAEAVELRHHHVGDDHVGPARARGRQRLTAVADRVDVPALASSRRA